MNKKEIKVYLQYPWKFPDSPYYKYLIDKPPEGIIYKNISNQKGVITNKKIFLFSNFLKRNIRKTLNFFNFSLPNAHLSQAGNYDLIHCAHCLSKNKNKPWVADMEGEWSMYIGNKDKRILKKVQRILKRKNCKKILPWTKKTAQNIIKEFPEIKNKIEVIYPAIPTKNINKKTSKNIYLIFSGRYFYDKGGLHALEAIDRLTKQYSRVYGIVNSEIPKEVLKNYSKNKKIEFYKLIPQKELFQIYNRSDIFIYPGYSDSFGFGFLEAMSFGLPIITVDGYARKEIVTKDVGIVIKKPKYFKYEQMKYPNEELTKKLVDATSRLIKNDILRKKMSYKGIEKIKNGKFSLKIRNKKLKKIYNESLE